MDTSVIRGPTRTRIEFSHPHAVRPDEVSFTSSGDPVPSPYASIPEAMWWCIVTLMTVGYGDVVPVTPPGKLVAGVTMVAGEFMESVQT